MRTLIVAAAMVASPLVAAAQRNDLRVQIPGWDVPILLDTIAAKSSLSGGREKIMAAIEVAFAHFELPVEAFDASVGRAPNRRVTKSRRLGKAPISRYLDCGRGFNGNNADVYRITIAAAAWPEPAAGEVTTLRVAIAASAQDPAGSRGGYQLCGTKGVFEREFGDRVRAILAGAS